MPEERCQRRDAGVGFSGVKPLVTISAAYGAGGSLVGPRLADRLGVPFLDRAIPVSVADHLEVPREGLTRQELPRDTFQRWLPRFAPAVRLYSGATADPAVMSEQEFRDATERVLHEYADAGAVILGRAAAAVLRDQPGALHVRLDGPADRRIGQAMVVHGVDRPTAERELIIADRARESYVQRWYGVDAHDPRCYDLIIDSTRINVDGCVELIAVAARTRASRAADPGRPATDPSSPMQP